MGQKQIIVRKPKSNTLTISVWQKHKKTISDLSVHKLIHKYAFGQIVTHHVYVVQAKTKKPILSVMENSFLFLKRLVELSKVVFLGLNNWTRLEMLNQFTFVSMNCDARIFVKDAIKRRYQSWVHNELLNNLLFWFYKQLWVLVKSWERFFKCASPEGIGSLLSLQHFH